MTAIATARRATHQLHAVYSVGKRKYHKCERCGREHEVQATRKPTICRDCRSVDPNWGKQ